METTLGNTLSFYTCGISLFPVRYPEGDFWMWLLRSLKRVSEICGGSGVLFNVDVSWTHGSSIYICSSIFNSLTFINHYFEVRLLKFIPY